MAVLSFSLVILSLPLLYALHSVTKLFQNYLIARRTGLPILINPTTQLSPVWLLTKNIIIPVARRLPSPLSAWVDRVDIGWNQQPKFSTHADLKSSAFWIVTPGTNQLYVADPAAADDVMRRCRTDFIKNPTLYGELDIFGQSVNSVNGKTWERHRRITVPPFNENVSESVWDEAGKQVEGAKRRWLALQDVRTTQNDCTRIALHVLTAAGFGMRFEFQDQAEGALVKDGHRMSYRDVVGALLKNMGIVIVFKMLRKVGWPMWAFWGGLKQIELAKAEFRYYMEEMVDAERERIRTGEAHKENLMSVLVRSAERAKNDDKGVPGVSLSDSEVFGNMFMYNLAGHDTTANTIHFALILLAIEPQWQEWLAEEIGTILEKADVSTKVPLKYQEVFPKLPRCLALMYETLRLYGPVPSLPRWTGSSWQKLTIDGRNNIELPPNTDIIINFAALHTHPNYWGTDEALLFRPDRWIRTEKQDMTTSRDVNEDHPYDWQSGSLMAPEPGTFVPWNAGSRVCPGKKFSQVEFVRVLAGLLSDGTRVRLVREKNESNVDAKTRALGIIREARVDFALKVQNSERIGMEWYKKN